MVGGCGAGATSLFRGCPSGPPLSSILSVRYRLHSHCGPNQACHSQFAKACNAVWEDGQNDVPWGSRRSFPVLLLGQGGSGKTALIHELVLPTMDSLLSPGGADGHRSSPPPRHGATGRGPESPAGDLVRPEALRRRGGEHGVPEPVQHAPLPRVPRPQASVRSDGGEIPEALQCFWVASRS